MEGHQWDDLDIRFNQIANRVEDVGAATRMSKPAQADAPRDKSDVVRGDDVLMHCMDDPGIPTPVKLSEIQWCPYWGIGAASCPFLFYLVMISLYTTIHIVLPPDELINLNVSVAGCDVLINECPGENWARLGWWHFLNVGGSGMNFDGENLTVDKQVQARLATYRCTVRMCLSPKAKFNDYHAKSLSLNLEADQASLQNSGASNLAETSVAYVKGVDLQGPMRLNSSTTARILLHGSEADTIEVLLTGGKLQVLEQIRHKAASVRHAKVYATDATVQFQLHKKNMKVHMDNITTSMASMSAARVESVDMPDGSSTQWLYRNRNPDTKGNPDAFSPANATNLYLTTRHSASYFLVADHEYMTNKDLSLETVRGDGLGVKRLLRDGVQAYQTLRKWLQKHGHEKFVVYMHMLHPHAPSGTIRLLSTAAYKAFSLYEFAVATGGMLSPQIIRIEAPVVGMDYLFPTRPCDPPLSQKLRMQWSKDIFDVIEGIVNISSLHLPQAKYLWDPAHTSSQDYMFDLIPPRQDKPEHWIERPVETSDTIMFTIAAYITIALGLVVGGVAVWGVNTFVIPSLLRKLRKDAITNASSYRRDYIVAATDWALNSCFISYPREGVLLRWDQRAMVDRFARLSFVARPWPISETHPSVKLDGVDPAQIPMHPTAPKQQIFCFASESVPQLKSLPANEFFVDPFDQAINGTWLLRQGQQPLAGGKPYQFQITALDAAKNVVEKSAWSRPTMIFGRIPFTNYPLVMWKVFSGILPTDTFDLFLNKYCLPVENAPSMIITFKKMQLAIAQSSVGLFAGALDTTYGVDVATDVNLKQEVKLYVSTGDEIQLSTDTLYVETKTVPLPTAASNERKPPPAGTLKASKEVFKPDGHYNQTLRKAKGFFMLDFKDQTLECPAGADLTEIVRIDAALQIGVSLNTEHTARFESTWGELSVKLNSLQNQGDPRISKFLVLSDGLQPAAVLQADVAFSNMFFKKTDFPKYDAGGFKMPPIFDNICPGSTYQWGEIVTLSWKTDDLSPPCPEMVDIIISSEKVDEPSDARKSPYKHVDSRLMSACGPNNGLKKVAIKTNVSMRSGKVSFSMAPNQPSFIQKMKAKLLVVDSKTRDTTNVVLCSSAFYCVTRPVTLQNLEVGYAAFCVRNNIPQGRLTDQIMLEHGIDIQERHFFTSPGYRPCLPIPREVKHLYRLPNHQLIVKDPGCIYITNGNKRDFEIFHSERLEALEKQGVQKKKSTTRKKSELEKPLLQTPEGVGDTSEQPKEKARVETITPLRSTMNIPTNVFWRYDQQWEPEVLLWYSFLPNCAVDGYIYNTLCNYEYFHLAMLLGKLDELCRLLFRVTLWLFQSAVLAVPAFLVIGLTMYHDTAISHVSPGSHLFQMVDTIYFTDFMISPSPFRMTLLESFDLDVLKFVVLYYFVVVVVTFLNNFFLNALRAKQSFLAKPLPYMDNVLAFSFTMLCFAFLVYISVVAVWILLGALIDPGRLMPYAIGLAGILLLVKTQYANLKMLRDTAESKMEDMLNGALHAMASVFVGDTNSGPWLDMGKEHEFASQIAELIDNNEEKLTEELYKQAAIETKISQDTIERYNLLRKSPAFIQCLADAEPNKILVSDFVPDSIIPIAQKIANEEAVIDGTRNLPDEHTGVVLDNDITSGSIAKGLSENAQMNVPKPGQLTADQKAKLDKMAEKLKMRPETSSLLSQAFSLATHLRRSPEEEALLEPLSCATMMSQIRRDQLFSHFIEEDEDGPDGKKVKTSNAKKMMAEIQNKDMENYNAVLAKALTSIVDWVALSRDAQHFLDIDLAVIVGHVVDTQLNEHVNGSAAFDLMLKVYDKAFSPSFETTYQSNPMRFYVDVGLITEAQSVNPKCKGILIAQTNLKRLFDGSLAPDTLISTVVSLFLPSARDATSDTGEVPNPLYLWYGAYKRLLTDLGFNKNEMDEAYLRRIWEEETKDSGGIYPFRLMETLNALIITSSGDGLWQAAMKLMMLQHNICGYASCNSATYEKEADPWGKVHQHAHDLFLMGGAPTLKYLTDSCPWPQYMEDLWAKYCRDDKRSAKIKAPDFLSNMGILEFLKDVIYVPTEVVKKIPEESEFAKLNAYPDSILDLVWLVRKKDGSLWHDLPDGKRLIRGIWHELVMKIWELLDCVPSDLDIFYMCLEMQGKKQLPPVEFIQKEGIFLRHGILSHWLKTEYLPNNTMNATFEQWKILVVDMLNVEIPDAVLKAQVFTPCPLVKDDDLGELRVIADLAAGLRMFIGYGLWQGGVGQIIEMIMPRGPMRSMALTSLPSEFVTQDTNSTGILQPAQAVILVHNLAHPGLTCDDLSITVQEDLGIEVNKREFHHYFTMVDVNCNGVLGLDEFIPFMQMMMLDYFPGRIMTKLNLSSGKIFAFLLAMVMVIVMVFLCVTLIMETFAAGSNIGSAIHSGVTAISLAASKLQAEASSGFNDSVSAVKKALTSLMMGTLVGVLGFAPQTVDVFKNVIMQLEAGLKLT